jgi:hypothetical protein
MDQQPWAEGRARHRLRPWFVVIALFVVVLGLGALHQGVSADEESGTIPPGGTVPPPPIDFTNGFIRVVHAAPFDPDIADTAVDICDENNTPVTGLTGLTYLSESGYLPFAPGFYDWYVGTPGCTQVVVDIPEFRLFRDSALTLLILGDNNNHPLTTVLSVDRAGLNRIQQLPLLFNSGPGEDDPKNR